MTESPTASPLHAVSGLSSRRTISVVIPAYNEESNIAELQKRLIGVFNINQKYDFEVIIVENGSHDNTWLRLIEANRLDSRFKSVRLSRNFRMDGGLTAGLSYASGDACIMMAADLQDPPELISQFIEKWEEGYENIYQVVTRRIEENILRKCLAQIFYWLINYLTNGMMPRNVSDYRLVDRKVYEAVRGMDERNRFIRGLFAWVGFKSVGVPCARTPRFSGTSHYTYFKVAELALKGIFSHTYLPLKLCLYFGLGISFLSFISLVLVTIKALFFGVPFAGWGSLFCIMLLMFGFLSTMLGVIGEYIGLIYEEVKQRPNFIVKDSLGDLRRF